MPISSPNGTRVARLVVSATLLVSAGAAADREVHKVSGTAVAGSDVTWVTSSLSTHRISPDGEWIIWIQDAEVNNAHALWAARRWGGTPKRLSGTLPPGALFQTVLFSPDSKNVLYSAEQDSEDQTELYTVPLLGTAADGVKLSPPLPAGEDVLSLPRFSVDGSRIVFNTTHPGTAGHTLFSAPVDGSSPAVGLDGPFDAQGMTLNFVVAPGRVVFQRQASPSATYEIWTVPIAGGAKTRLTPPIVGSGGAMAPRLAPGGARVAFLMKDAPTQPADELWSAAVGGAAGSAVRLADVPAAGGDVYRWDFTFDGSRVVFTADREIDEKYELYSVPTNGSAPPVKLSTGLIAAGDVNDFETSPDGTTVVYSADWAFDNRAEVFSVPILGPSAAGVRLNRTLTAGETTLPGAYFDDQILYVVGDTAGTYANELRGAPYGGPASAEWPVLLAETLISGPGVVLPERSVLKADVGTPGDFELWTMKNDGSGAPESLFNPLWTNVVLGSASEATPDSVEIFFLASIADGPLHLWATRIDGQQPLPRRLSLVPESSGGVIDDQAALEATPDGRGVLYEADSEVATREELFISDALIFMADFDEEGDTSEWSE